ncbi:MAG: type II secretion system F family protein [Myxococcota bacterium]|nr:type II secretion system F family protein [Myxococcota bacterium]MDW8363780.1 type II secretion system F family protein [Myxococcales bacterium]
MLTGAITGQMPPVWMAYLGIGLLVVGASAGLALLAYSPEGWLRRMWARYEAALEAECRFLFLATSGARIARMQLLLLTALLVAAALLEEVLLLVAAVLVALAPWATLRRRRDQRITELERQLDTWLLLLANALKATPSLGEAIAASARIVRPPIQQELDLLLKQVQLGTPLDAALLETSARVGSPTVSSALATLLVARQTGGDLPRVLEESAATLREMARLEGVVRTKTAEGKSQAWVLGAIPFLLLGAIHAIDPMWLRPLTDTPAGWGIIAVATLLWVGAIAAARKILAVDV